MTRTRRRRPSSPTSRPASPLAATPGIVTLSWDRVADVQDYTLLMTAPVTGESEIASTPTAADAQRLESRIKVETVDNYCYQLVALREGAADSAPSEQACVQTALPPDGARRPHGVAHDRAAAAGARGRRSDHRRRVAGLRPTRCRSSRR